MSEVSLLNVSPGPDTGPVPEGPASNGAGTADDGAPAFARVLDEKVAGPTSPVRGPAAEGVRPPEGNGRSGQGEPAAGRQTAAAATPDSGPGLPPETLVFAADGNPLPPVTDAVTVDVDAPEDAAPVTTEEAAAGLAGAVTMPAVPVQMEIGAAMPTAGQAEPVPDMQQARQPLDLRVVIGEPPPRGGADRGVQHWQRPAGEDGIDWLTGVQEGGATARTDAASRIPDMPVHAAARLFLDTALRGESIEGNRWAGALQSVAQAGVTQTVPGGPAPAGTPAAPLVTTLDIPFRQSGWEAALGERLVWMTSQQLQAAEIRLNPPHLGPMEVRIQFGSDQAQIHVASQHAVVREAIETSIPRLREIFDNAGVQLGDVNVSQHSFAQQRQPRDPAGAGGTSGRADGAVAAGDDAGDAMALVRATDHLQSLLDVFA